MQQLVKLLSLSLYITFVNGFAERFTTMSGEISNSFYGVPSVVDTATHVWGNGGDPFPYVNEPPLELKDSSGISDLRSLMDKSSITTALITQPINYKFDHSYLDSVLDRQRFYGIFLLNPQLSLQDGYDYINRFKDKGYVGMRLNPALFHEGESMSGDRGLAFYDHAGKKGLPVNVMCFSGGITKYHDEIVLLLETHPETKLAIDHVGFFLQNGKIDEKSFELLLSLSKYPQVFVKFSALFRLSLDNVAPFIELDKRLVALKNAYGPDRIMIGSDYPFTQLHGGYENVIESYAQWPMSKDAFTMEDWSMILGGTASKLYNLI